MRISEFAEKYGLSNTLVREASFEVPETPGQGYWRRKDIPEEELFEAVKKNIEKKLKNAQDAVEKNKKRLERLMEGRDT